MGIDNIQIQPLRSLGEMQHAVDLQRIYWGHDPESVIPAHMLFSLASNGGHVLAATDGDTFAGVLIGFIGTNMEMSDRPAMSNLHVYSKRMVVRPEYRHYGLGTRLKLAQRDYAMQQGIRLVVWTFDPLLSRNAYLNISKLGCISRSFRENYYGTDNIGGLSPLGYSDRLLCEWWITKNRVKERANPNRKSLSLQHYLDANAVLVNPTTVTSEKLALPADTIVDAVGSTFILVEIPHDFPELVQQDAELAKRWRESNRASLGHYMRQDYIITDFVSADYEGRQRSFYILSMMPDETFN